MVSADLVTDIETPVLHRDCPRSIVECETTDEFSYLIDDDDDTDYPYIQNVQDLSCIMNEENTIYDAVFGDKNLDAVADFKEEIYQSWCNKVQEIIDLVFGWQTHSRI